MKKTSTRWKTFDFHGNTTSVNKKAANTRERGGKKVPSLEARTGKTDRYKNSLNTKMKFDLYEKLSPKTSSELAIHPKKVKEVENWLQNNILHRRERTARFLLVTGPTGCGKYATLKTLCKDLRINVAEWSNPMDFNYEFSEGTNQVSTFREFLSRSKYPSLDDVEGSNKKLVIIQDYPNAIIRNPKEFSNILEDHRHRPICVAFICTDSHRNSNDSSLSQTLFPQEIRDKFNVTTISFNPCAATLLKQSLKRAQLILSENPEMFKNVPPSAIDAIVVTCMGDLRSAMSQLYIASLIGGPDLTITKSKSASLKRKRGSDKVQSASKSQSNIPAMLKDECLGLFRGLGRVLNPKRDDVGRIACDFEKLVGEFETRPKIFVGFLFENYLNYFGDLNDAAEASELLSSSQNFFIGWNESDLRMGLWLSAMGLMVNNYHQVTKWNPIRGPRKVDKKIQDGYTLEKKNLSATDLFYYEIITKNRSTSSVHEQIESEGEELIIEEYLTESD